MSDEPALDPDDGHLAEKASEWLDIGNEFAFVRVRKVYTRNGERLQIVAPKMGFEIMLDALALEAVSWQKPEMFSNLLQSPFGPEATSGLADRTNPLDADA
jgi:hypothetical protein